MQTLFALAFVQPGVCGNKIDFIGRCSQTQLFQASCFLFFFSLIVLNTLQNTVHSKHYPLVYLIFLISTGVTVCFVQPASAATKFTLQAGVVKHNLFRPLVFYFFSLNVLNTPQNTVHSKHYPLVYLIFLISTSITAFYRLHFQKPKCCRRSWRHSLIVY